MATGRRDPDAAAAAATSMDAARELTGPTGGGAA